MMESYLSTLIIGLAIGWITIGTTLRYIRETNAKIEAQQKGRAE